MLCSAPLSRGPAVVLEDHVVVRRLETGSWGNETVRVHQQVYRLGHMLCRASLRFKVERPIDLLEAKFGRSLEICSGPPKKMS